VRVNIGLSAIYGAAILQYLPASFAATGLLKLYSGGLFEASTAPLIILIKVDFPEPLDPNTTVLEPDSKVCVIFLRIC